jgi:hypothetical protein
MKFRHTSSGNAVRNSSNVNICSLDVFNLNINSTFVLFNKVRVIYFSTTSSTGFSQPTYWRAKSAVATANY